MISAPTFPVHYARRTPPQPLLLPPSLLLALWSVFNRDTTVTVVVLHNFRILVITIIRSPLFQTLHLSALHLVELLLASMDAANLVAHDIHVDILLRLGLLK